jgi:peroxiredoxin
MAALELAPLPRAAAPPFTLADLDGRPLSLASLRGQTVLLYFWATWCPYCQKELPATVQELARRYRDRRLVVLAVNIQEGRDKVRAWVKMHGLSVPVVLDSDGEVSGEYRVTATPTAVLVDREGRTVARAVGTRAWMSERARPSGTPSSRIPQRRARRPSRRAPPDPSRCRSRTSARSLSRRSARRSHTRRARAGSRA